jgi:hypothetical protein
MWMAELNGEVLNYNPRDILIKDAIENDLDFIVLRVHRDGTATARIIAAEAEAREESER